MKNNKQLSTYNVLEKAIKINLIAVMACIFGSGQSYSGIVSCAKLSAETSYIAVVDTVGLVDWVATSANNLTVRGVGCCGAVMGAYVGAKQDSCVIDYTLNNSNVYCWCKMTNPVVSGGWVYVAKILPTSNCVTSCSRRCSFELISQTATSFRASLFSDILD